MHKSSGLSLLELLIVTSIIAIVSIIVVPITTHIVQEHYRKQQLERLISIVRFARYHALELKQTITICPIDTKQQCINNWQQPIAVFGDEDNKAKIDSNDSIIRMFNADAHGTLHLSAFPSADYFRFNRHGYTDNQNGSFRFCLANKGWKLIINRAGRMREEIVNC